MRCHRPFTEENVIFIEVDKTQGAKPQDILRHTPALGLS